MELHRAVAFDASTLILLAKTDLLQVVAPLVEVHIPRAVEKEARAKPDLYDAQLIARMIKDGEIRISDHIAASAVKLVQKQFRLGEGEAAALWMAKENRCVVGIDDGPGIRAAKILGVPFVTAIQILVGLHSQAHLDKPSAIAKLDSLLLWGRYGAALISDARSKIQGREGA